LLCRSWLLQVWVCPLNEVWSNLLIFSHSEDSTEVSEMFCLCLLNSYCFISWYERFPGQIDIEFFFFCNFNGWEIIILQCEMWMSNATRQLDFLTFLMSLQSLLYVDIPINYRIYTVICIHQYCKTFLYTTICIQLNFPR
jgi:hypothetical protein